MVSAKTSEELPPGWKEFVKVKNGRKTKYFTNLATGQKFYSKKSAIHFANSLEIHQDSSPSTITPDNGSMPCKTEATSDDVKTNEYPDWLPCGWTMESRTRKSGSGVGSVYKIYTDPLTRCKFYSKPQVMQYLQGIENKNAKGKQHLQISEETPPKQQDMSVHHESMEIKIHFSEENKDGMGKPSLKGVEEYNGSDELPPGCTQEIKTRKHSRGIRKCQQDTSQASESMDGKNHISGENENDMGMPSLKIDYSDVQEKNGIDELPPGWIKEIKTRKCGPGMKKDPYYIDTASGYVFRSKKDVMRYLETGDIWRCVIKPQKRDISEMKLIKEDTHLSTAHDGNESGESAARRQLFAGQKPENGKECCQTSTTAAAQTEWLKDQDHDSIIEKSKDDSIPAFATKFTASTIQETHLGSGTTECDKSGENSGPKAEGSKQDIEIVHDNVAVNRTDNDGFHGQKLTENLFDTETKQASKKFKKRKPPSMPARSSKRLAGHEPEMLPNFSLTERALRAAIKKPHEVEADRQSSMSLNTAANEVPQQPLTEAETTRSSSLALNTAADELPQQPLPEAETTRSSSLAADTAANELPQQPLTEAETTRSSSLAADTAANEFPQQPLTEAETTRSSSLAADTAANEMPQQPLTEPQTMVAHHTSVCAETSLETELKSNLEIPPVHEGLQQTTGQASERQVEENPMAQGDYWSDPCWDFAFKTLTGAIPLEDTLTLQSCFPQQTGTSYSQENLTFGLPEFEIPAIFQNDVLPIDQVQNNVPADQSSMNPTFPAPGNISLPSCSSQPPSLEARSKDYQTKVNS